ncbi:MAG TPA: hypothetical protein VM821_00570, partial [Abditibacteriaceae bacterium]|nr:hypothetical protein [Abditibacteriaceae bacterium]
MQTPFSPVSPDTPEQHTQSAADSAFAAPVEPPIAARTVPPPIQFEPVRIAPPPDAASLTPTAPTPNASLTPAALPTPSSMPSQVSASVTATPEKTAHGDLPPVGAPPVVPQRPNALGFLHTLLLGGLLACALVGL